MGEKYPFYFEVKCDDGTQTYEEGGFAYAADWDEAAAVVKEAYGDELVSMHLEMFDNYEFCFPLAKARKIKEVMGV